MDPIYDIDIDGNGTVIFYAFGHSYEFSVKGWEVSNTYQAPDGEVARLAQKYIYQLRLDRESVYCGGE